MIGEMNMKKSIYLTALALIAAAGCSKEQEGTIYKPNADDAKEIHFIQSSLAKEFEQSATTGTMTIEVARPGNRGELTVYLSNKGTDAKAFSAPDYVTIPDGSYSADVNVDVDLASLNAGATFSTTLYITDRQEETGNGSALVSQYTDKIKLSASFALTWEPYYTTDEKGNEVQQTATYHYNAFYSGRDSGLKVEKAAGTNIFRLNDWASGVTFKFILNADNTCTVPAQSIGYYNSNYNEYVQVADMAVYTGNSAAYSSYPCTYDGKGNFSFYLIYYVSAGYFAQGTETLTFDGSEDKTPEVAISFDGIETTETGFKAPRLSFSKNDYTKFYKATVVAGDITGDAARQEQVRTMLMADQKPGTVPVVTLYDDYSDLWNVAAGNCTAVALAYESDDAEPVLYLKRFTCDPAGIYAPKVNEFDWFNDESNPSYSPFSTLFWTMQASNVSSIKYLCMRTDYLDYMISNLKTSAAELAWERGNEVNEETVAKVNSEEGLATLFNTLKQGLSYTICICLSNEFGDTVFVQKTASTKGYSAADFDKNVTLDDFLGAFKASAVVDQASGSSSEEESFRVDIYSLGGNDVVINGLSNTRDFTPGVKGWYDADNHAIIIEPQDLGQYNGSFVRLGFSDGLSIYWGANSLAFGFVNGTIQVVAGPDASAPVNSYQFLLFSSPAASGSTYLRQSVGNKVYSAMSLTPLTASKAASSGADVLGELAVL